MTQNYLQSQKKRIFKSLGRISISFSDLLNIEYAQAYLEHLEKLGLIENYQQYPNVRNYTIRVKSKRKEQILSKGKYTCLDNIRVKSKAYRLTKFGNLFHNIVNG